MSQEEHILHTLKEMSSWTANADKQFARVKWALYGLLTISVIILLVVIFK